MATAMSEERIAKAIEERNKAIEAAATTGAIIDILNGQYLTDLSDEPLDYENHFKQAYKRAIELAATTEEAWLVFCDADVEEVEEEEALAKALSFAKDKEDVESILVGLTDRYDIDLSSEKHLLMIFKRAHELPNRNPVNGS